MSAKVTLVCATCRGPFQRYRSQVERGYGRFCSAKCRTDQPRSEIVSGSNACIRAAFAGGYRATPGGAILAPSGESVKVQPAKPNRYMTFSASRCRTPIAVHRFIAYQLFGEPALAAECVRHLNNDRTDHRFKNIEPGTRSQNQLDIPIDKRRLMGRRRNREKRQFTDEQVREIRKLFKEGFGLRRLQRVLGCGFGSLTNIRDGVTYLDVA